MTSRPTPGLLVPVLVGLGGVLAGAALAALAFMVLSRPLAQDGVAMLPFGEPIEEVGAIGAGARIDGAQAAPATAMEIVIDVAGAVARPGLHRLHAGDRVGDAIEAAGGFAPRVDLAATSQSLNLAQPLEDGTKVLVPELGVDRPEVAADAGSADGLIDLNHADQAELESLPGIGPVTAGKIMAARAESPFTSVRDLRTRGLVGESVFGDIEQLVQAR